MMNSFVQGLGIVVGVIAGVVAGTFVTVVIRYIEIRSAEKQRKKNLIFEFQFDIKKIESFKAELNNYLNAIAGDALKTYHAYFDLSKIIYPTAQNMFNDGSLYKLFDKAEDLMELQKTFSNYSIGTEEDFNKRIKENTEICGTDKWQEVKSDVVAYNTYYKKFFEDDISTLENFLKKLQ